MSVTESPSLFLVFKSAKDAEALDLFQDAVFESNFVVKDTVQIRNIESYMFERNMLVPAAAFRFTAPGVEKALRMAIRSGDLVQILVQNRFGDIFPLATGFVDETDTHITASSVDLVITGRDVLGQFVDNSAIDANNKIIALEQATLLTIVSQMIQGTRIPFGVKAASGGLPNGQFLFQTNPGETKINAIQRYLEFANCLIWATPGGIPVVGKPDFAQPPSGKFTLSYSNPSGNNVLEARVRRAPNLAIRDIVVQLQSLSMDPKSVSADTRRNDHQDVRAIAKSLGGRSVYMPFSYGQGNAAVNQLQGVGTQSANPNSIGAQYALREMAKENMKVLDIELVVYDHFNENDRMYNVDSLYDVFIEDEDVQQEMYVYHVTYEMTKEHGAVTRLKLCPKYTIVTSGTVIKNDAYTPTGSTAGATV